MRNSLTDAVTAPADRRAALDDRRTAATYGLVAMAHRWITPTYTWAALTHRWSALAGLALLPVLCLSGLLAVPQPMAAEMILETSVDRDSVLIADPIIYTIEVLAPADLLVEPPPPAQQLGPFEVLDYRILPAEEVGDEPASRASGEVPGKRTGRLKEVPREQAGPLREPAGEQAGSWQRTRIRWTLVPYRTGRLEIPAVALTVADTTGPIDTLSTGTEIIEVASLEPDLQGDIRDIKPPEELARGWAWIAWLIGGLILLAGGLWLLRAVRRRRLRQALEEVPYQGPPRPAHQIAMEELNRIAALHLLDKGMVKEHYIQVSDTIRRYAEGRYAIGSMELTTWELIGEMRRTAVPKDHRRTFRSFLEECDLVKFAKYIPPAEVRETLLERARQLVLFTRIPPRPEAPEQTQTPPPDAQPAGVPG